MLILFAIAPLTLDLSLQDLCEENFFLATLESFIDQIVFTLPLNDAFHSNYAA